MTRFASSKVGVFYFAGALVLLGVVGLASGQNPASSNEVPKPNASGSTNRPVLPRPQGIRRNHTRSNNPNSDASLSNALQQMAGLMEKGGMYPTIIIDYFEI